MLLSYDQLRRAPLLVETRSRDYYHSLMMNESHTAKGHGEVMEVMHSATFIVMTNGSSLQVGFNRVRPLCVT